MLFLVGWDGIGQYVSSLRGQYFSQIILVYWTLQYLRLEEGQGDFLGILQQLVKSQISVELMIVGSVLAYIVLIAAPGTG